MLRPRAFDQHFALLEYNVDRFRHLVLAIRDASRVVVPPPS